MAQHRETDRGQSAVSLRAQFGDELREHADIVGAAKAARQDQHGQAGLPQRVLELVETIRGVDVDEDCSDFGRRVLRHDPFRAVRAPDPHAIAWLHPDRQQPARGTFHLVVELAIRVAPLLMTDDERVAIAERPRRAVEAGADRLAEQRDG